MKGMVIKMTKKKSVGTLQEYMDTRLTPEHRDKINFEVSLMSKVIMARKEQGISQKELAEKAGMKQPAIARLESLRVMPKVDTLIDVLHPLGYTLEIVPLKR